MTEGRLRAAIIGCGAIAHEHLPYLAASPRVELVAVCDTSPALASFMQKRFRAAACFTDAGKMLRQTQPEVVHVLTPPQTHASLIRMSLEAGAHVICEKPMTGSAGETEALLTEAGQRGKLLVESRNLLFNDAAIAIDRMKTDGQLGIVREVDVLLSLDLTAGPFGDLNLSGPGVALPAGAVHDFLPHLAYLFLHFAGSPAEADRVTGFLENRSGNPRVGFDHLDVLIEAGGVRGRLRIASDVAPPAFRLIVRGSERSVETDFYNPFLRVEGGANVGKRAPLEQIGSGLKLARAGVRNFFDKVRQHGTYHGMPRMLDAFYRALESGQPSPVAAADMLATARLVDRIVSLRTSR
ncbi:MAG TPA: Gfo/Idh/MocA family oxidoreductase [Sphingomicrobium sp.]|nr:Gfo/Idh/MocA family oxidoreductase [Sphingomicrobium sp.]